MSRKQNTQSIYGQASYSQNIYGASNNPGCAAILDIALFDLSLLTTAIRDVVDEFFPAAIAKARVVGNLSSTTGMSPILFVRLYWAKMHPKQKFKNTEYEQLELIDIYLKYPPLEWRDDYLITVKL
jgi:hypothetical protein